MLILNQRQLICHSRGHAHHRQLIIACLVVLDVEVFAVVDDDAAVDPLREDLEEGRRRRPHQELGHRAAVLVPSLTHLK